MQKKELRLVSGKHPVTVRLGEEDYKACKLAAFENGMSVNEWLAELGREGAAKMANERRKE